MSGICKGGGGDIAANFPEDDEPLFWEGLKDPMNWSERQFTPKSLQEEVRVVDPKTGGVKCQKLERFDLIPNEFEIALARHYGKGAEKYDDRNWEKGYRWSLSVGALRRHLAAWLGGESIDPETGSNHLIAVAWHACALFIFELRGLGTDDVRRKT